MALSTDEIPIRGSEREGPRSTVGLIALVVLVLALTSLTVLAGEHLLEVVFWLFGAVTVSRAIQALGRPGKVMRLQTDREFDHIIARGGLELAPAADGASPREAQLAIQDALDAIDHESRSPLVGRSGVVRLRVVALASLSGGIAVLVYRDDPAGAAALVLGAAAFEGLAAYARRLGRRLQAAKEALSTQMRFLEGETVAAAPPRRRPEP
ncbi:MAG: hypothetical protein PVJ02_13225 [Gemmatimonadota bacterium]|jgi:hypothetical protein